MNEKAIWNFLYGKTGNPYGTAAIMGNLMAESSLNPAKTNGAKAGASTYVSDADSGKIDFAHDKVAFGLVQWYYWSRKQALMDYAKEKGTSVGDLTTQLEFMWNELQSYKTVLNAVKNATDVREASDVVMLKYEKPGNTTESAKQKRASYGQKYFDQFAKVQPSKQDGKMVVANVSVNIRTGDSKSYTKIGSMAAGTKLPYVATAENGWYAVRYKSQVAWVSNDFSKIES